MLIALMAISSELFFPSYSALAAAKAKLPPEPTDAILFSGSNTSPEPVIIKAQHHQKLSSWLLNSLNTCQFSNLWQALQMLSIIDLGIFQVSLLIFL